MNKFGTNYIKKLLLPLGVLCAIGVWFVPYGLFSNPYLAKLYTRSNVVTAMNVKTYFAFIGIILIMLSYKMRGNESVIESTGRFTNIKALDGIRSFAALSIIMYHWQPYRFPATLHQNYMYLNVSYGDVSAALNNFLIFIFQFGDLALGAFVIISGIGLSMNYYCSKSHDKKYWMKFYRKRLARLLPLFWSILVIAYSRAYFSGEKVTWQGLLGNMFMLGNFNPQWREELGLVNGPLWFVPYIFMLYLLFPALIWMKKKLGNTLFVISLIALEIVYCNTFVWTLPLSRAGQFGLGIVLGDMFTRDPKRSQDIIEGPLQTVFCIALLTVLVNLTNEGLSYGLTHSMIELCVFITLWNVSVLISRTGFFARLLSWLAFSSYAVYLIHHTAIKSMPQQLREGNSAVYGLLFALIIFIIAYMIAGLEAFIRGRLKQSFQWASPERIN
ncbi:MAG: acyltransferase [Nitrospirae bacterium]|nr:acyltransferase [Nitrospirota bacterium]